jgi:hypothetical protein
MSRRRFKMEGASPLPSTFGRKTRSQAVSIQSRNTKVRSGSFVFAQALLACWQGSLAELPQKKPLCRAADTAIFTRNFSSEFFTCVASLTAARLVILIDLEETEKRPLQRLVQTAVHIGQCPFGSRRGVIKGRRLPGRP